MNVGDLFYYDYYQAKIYVVLHASVVKCRNLRGVEYQFRRYRYYDIKENEILESEMSDKYITNKYLMVVK